MKRGESVPRLTARATWRSVASGTEEWHVSVVLHLPLDHDRRRRYGTCFATRSTLPRKFPMLFRRRDTDVHLDSAGSPTVRIRHVLELRREDGFVTGSTAPAGATGAQVLQSHPHRGCFTVGPQQFRHPVRQS